jgi:hypothetical protein
LAGNFGQSMAAPDMRMGSPGSILNDSDLIEELLHLLD